MKIDLKLIEFIKKNQGKFLVRIEDTDKKRSRDSFKSNILDSLDWLGIKWDNEPQIQSQNIKRHLEIANYLLTNRKAYKCACKENELEEFNKQENQSEGGRTLLSGRNRSPFSQRTGCLHRFVCRKCSICE